MARLNPYLSFKSEARSAMEFYQSVFGGDLTITTFGEYDMGQDPSENDRVMHSQLETPAGFTLMASDTPSTMPFVQPVGVSISIDGTDEPSLEGYWNKLAETGIVTMPLDTPPWGGRFGMLTDRFGIEWMISVNAEG